MATDRPALTEEIEIEVTPEMIEAGVLILCAMDLRFERHEDVVTDMFVIFKKYSKVQN